MTVSDFKYNIIKWNAKPLKLVCFMLRQVDLGDDPCSTKQKLKILKEQDEAVAAFKVSQWIGLIHIKYFLVTFHWMLIYLICVFQLKYSGESVASLRSSTRLFSRRILRDAGQVRASLSYRHLDL